MEVSKTGQIQNFEKIENQEAEVNGARTKGTTQIKKKITSLNEKDKLIEERTPVLRVYCITGQVMDVSKTSIIQNFEKTEIQEAEVNGAQVEGTAHNK